MEVTVELDKFTIMRKNENSDEPFLWVVYIEVDGSTLKVSDLQHSSAKVVAPLAGHGDLGEAASHLEVGGSVDIPIFLGRWTTQMVPIDNVPPQLAESLSVIAVLVLGLEEDATSSDAVQKGKQALVDTLQVELNKSIQAGVSPNPGALAQQAQQAVVDAIKSASVSALSFLPISSLFDIAGIADPDDFVGNSLAGPFTFKQINDAGTAGIAFTLNLGASQNSDGFYQVTGRLQRKAITKRLYDAVWRPGSTGETQQYGMKFADYQAQYDALWAKGSRIYRLNTYVENQQVLYDAVWRPGNDGETQHYGMKFADYQSKYDALWKQGSRIYLLNTYTVDGKDVLYDAVWRPGNNGETQHYGMKFSDYQAKYDVLWKQGQRLYLLNTYVLANNEVLYDAVWRPGNSGETQFYGLKFADYQAHYDTLWKQGLRLYLFNTYTMANNQVLYDAVWRPAANAEVQHYAQDRTQYQANYDALWKQNWRIELLNTYEEGGL